MYFSPTSKFSQVSLCELHILSQKVMDQKKSDHIQRDRFVIKANNTLQQLKKYCFKINLSCIKL